MKRARSRAVFERKLFLAAMFVPTFSAAIVEDRAPAGDPMAADPAFVARGPAEPEVLESVDDTEASAPPGFAEAPAPEPAATPPGPSPLERAEALVGARDPHTLPPARRVRAARLFMLAGRYERAWTLLSTVPRAFLGREGATEAAMAAVAARHAREGLVLVGAAPRGSERARYWWARLAQASGRGDLARPVFEALAAVDPPGYYGVWAGARLRELGGDDTGAGLSPVVLDGKATRPASDRPTREDATRELEGLIERRGGALPWLARARALVSQGDATGATQELRTAWARARGRLDRDDRVALARVGRAFGDDGLALRIERPRSQDLRARHRDAWRELVLDASARHAVDPDLVWAVMFRESHFRSEAVSPASALGLMQVMPRSGERIARERGITDFSPEDLLDPARAIDFGAYNLATLLRRFGGRVPLAVAAYNAGPHRVDAWLSLRGHVDLDVFCEQIPFEETHRYVQRVLQSLALYQS